MDADMDVTMASTTASSPVVQRLSPWKVVPPGPDAKIHGPPAPLPMGALDDPAAPPAAAAAYAAPGYPSMPPGYPPATSYSPATPILAQGAAPPNQVDQPWQAPDFAPFVGQPHVMGTPPPSTRGSVIHGPPAPLPMGALDDPAAPPAAAAAYAAPGYPSMPPGYPPATSYSPATPILAQGAAPPNQAGADRPPLADVIGWRVLAPHAGPQLPAPAANVHMQPQPVNNVGGGNFVNSPGFVVDSLNGRGHDEWPEILADFFLQHVANSGVTDFGFYRDGQELAAAVAARCTAELLTTTTTTTAMAILERWLEFAKAP